MRINKDSNTWLAVIDLLPYPPFERQRVQPNADIALTLPFIEG